MTRLLGALRPLRRLRDVVPCRQPMVLVSQIQRSGGSLLSQLFDDHPALLVHPHELSWGSPNKWDWPDLRDVANARFADLWGLLHSSFIDKAIDRGYQKGEFSNRLPFVFDRLLQVEIFRAAVKDGIDTQRGVFDAYMTSFFNAWLDYQNLYRGPKLYTVAFTPRVSMYPEYITRFFRDYPDGHVISILRDPLSWLASAKKHARSQKDMRDKSTENLMDFWKASAEALIENKRRHGTRYHVVRYGDLVREPETAMRGLADSLGIAFHETLLTPTFNSMPILANTSHETLKDETGIVSSTLDVYRDVLDEREIDAVRTRFEPLHDEVAGLARSR